MQVGLKDKLNELGNNVIMEQSDDDSDSDSSHASKEDKKTKNKSIFLPTRKSYQ
jgi:hypothetical protein